MLVGCGSEESAVTGLRYRDHNVFRYHVSHNVCKESSSMIGRVMQASNTDSTIFIVHTKEGLTTSIQTLVVYLLRISSSFR